MRCAGLLALALCLGVTALASAEPLKPFVKSSLPEILKRHAGRPTIVHFWGMTCGPCRTEMPRWGAFLATHEGADVVTIDTDIVAGAPGAAEAFLADAKMPTTDAWRFADPFAEKLYFAVDPNWQGEIPMTLLIEPDGRVTRKVGAVEMRDVEAWLKARR